MRHLLLLCCLFALSAIAFSQKKSDTTVEIKEVVLTGFLPNSPKLTSLNIEPYSLKRMNEKPPFNLCDALAKHRVISKNEVLNFYLLTLHS
ncbi:hypothetical protein EMGBS15_07820 [Filimonas sp.]|nr:hypothetical protein EMGBS15_07820 [Filimonas sp.]